MNNISNDVEEYALRLLVEEPSELQKAVGKWMRFGPDHATRDGQTARANASLEAGDVLAAIDWAVSAGVLDAYTIVKQRERKFAKLVDPDARDDQGNRLAPELRFHGRIHLQEFP